MTRLPIDIQKKIIELETSQMFSLDEICTIVGFGKYAVSSFLKSCDIHVLDKLQVKRNTLVKSIVSLYEKHHDIALLFLTFTRQHNEIVAYLNTLNLAIDDEIVIQFFVTHSGKCANARYFSIKKKCECKIATDFEQRIFDYINCRFNDSESFIETYVRIKYGIEVRPVCEECGNKVAFVNSKQSGLFQRFCCRKCANSNELTKQRVREYNLKTYGVPVTSQAQCVKDKAKAHFQETYGVDNPWQAEECKTKAKQTKYDKYGDENYNNRPKSEATCLDRYGVRVSSQNAEVQRKASISYHLIVFEKFGTEWPMQNDDVKAKFHNTMSVNYNSTAYLSSNAFKKKCFELYGVENPMQCSEIRKKTMQKYSFMDISFDSAPEIAFFIFLKDNNIPFEYQPNISFDYKYDGKIHKYFPDFKVGDICFEIKGDHFFKEDGTMQNPFDHSQDELYEAKHQCMLMNDIVVLKNSEYSIFIKYVHSTYGKDFLKQFKRS